MSALYMDMKRWLLHKTKEVEGEEEATIAAAIATASNGCC